MIKVLIALLAIPLLLTSCGDEGTEEVISTEEQLENNFVITGSISNMGSVPVYLEAMSQNGTIAVEQTTSDNSGKFRLEGNIPGFGLYQLKLGANTENIIPLTLVPGDELNITSTIENFTMSPVLTGTEWSEAMTGYMQTYSNFHAAQAELMANKDAYTNAEITEKFIALKAPVDSFALAVMNADPGNPFNIVLSASATPAMGFNEWDPENLDVLNKVADAYNKKFPNSAITASLSNQIYQIDQSYKQHVVNTSGTFAAPEIALNNPDGVEMKLSDLKGKYVLIDFWASWCGPCRRENPNVVRLYNKYKNKGFTVFSVSLDDNAEAWKQAIEKDGLIWPNHVSDLLKWNSPLPQLYGFNGIPHTVLVNKEGNVIGVGLRGASLEQKLEELFSK